MPKHSMDHPHSTSIQKCEYDDELKEMHITFATGSKHCFKDIPIQEYHDLNNAKSKGSHFHQRIRRAYKSEKVD